MKIQGCMMGEPLSYGQAAQEKRTEQEKKTMPEQPVFLTISKEGLESSRGSLAGSRSCEDAVRQKQFLKEVKLSPDLDYSFRFKIGESLSDEDRKASGEPLTHRGRMEEMAKTYTSLYDEIVQGYENGTRQIHVSDPDSEKGHRTLTMEEELDALDQAYKKAVHAREEIGRQQPAFQKALEDYRSKLEKIDSKRADRVGDELKRMDDPAQRTPSGLAEQMIAAKNTWREQYRANPATAWQMFQNTVAALFR